jgi:NADH dehydrogenase [ubiquinone] 1 alpha subcomplex assembly factor 7
MSLRERLIAAIAAGGPMSVADYMTACLHDPEAGYYAAQPRLGAAGDFITAPHVSQMFGELLGLWAAEVWERLGRPSRVRLVELGPGDGTMMADGLRAARSAPGFLAACEVWLVETSSPLIALQKAALAHASARWVASLADVPTDAPLIILANEFLDCLPIDQAVLTPKGWTPRRIGVDGAGRLAFQPPRSRAPGTRAIDAVIEWSDALTRFGRGVGEAIAAAGGAALFIDYGRDGPGRGDTLQAVRRHTKESPLAHPGAADLTAHVDFPAFLRAAQAAGARTAPVRSQGDFLRAVGVEARAAVLVRSRPDKAGLIGRQLARLTAPDQMGDLFKAACLHSPGPVPAGFDEPP